MSATLDIRIRQSGLLSQWRGYGSDGGYAIVFDTKKIEDLLKQEAEPHHYQHVQIGDVYYYGLEQTIQPSSGDVAELEEAVQKGIGRLIRGGTADDTGGFYQAITSLSCLYKHWGFLEEHEVRVVVVPVDVEVAKLATAEGEVKLRKCIKAFNRDRLLVPYLELFARQNSTHARSRLPIERVIIGPHRDSTSRKKAVEQLLTSNGYEASVVCSKIPYIGR